MHPQNDMILSDELGKPSEQNKELDEQLDAIDKKIEERRAEEDAHVGVLAPSPRRAPRTDVSQTERNRRKRQRKKSR